MKRVERLRFNCAACSKPVERVPSLATAKNVCCSKKCVGVLKRHGSTLNCLKCGKQFYRRFGEQRKADRQYCSRECYDIHRDNGKSYKKVGGRHLHRIVAEQILGRPLRDGEIAHHEDRNRRNNSRSNIKVLKSQSDHARIHFSKKPVEVETVER